MLWFSTMIEVRNQKNFEARLDGFAKKIGVDVGILIKKLSFDIFADVVAGTPVDTGRAMNNWVINVGTPSREVTDQGGDVGSIIASKTAEAFALPAGPFSTVWISNNLPYIVFLEEGSSKQAPRGWVAAAVQNNLAQLARFAK